MIFNDSIVIESSIASSEKVDFPLIIDDSHYETNESHGEIDAKSPPDWIDAPHWQEWLASCVAPDLIGLNVRSLHGTQAYDHLIYSDKLPRRNDGRLSDWVLRKYRHTEQGGWWVSGVDPLNDWQEMLWGQFKPNQPRIDSEKNKPIKYEAPPRTATRAIILRVTWAIGLKIAQQQGLSDEYKLRLAEADADAALSDEDSGFWGWVLASGCAVVCCEGAKKAGALLSAGYAAIALPGIFNGISSKGFGPKQEGKVDKVRELIPELKPFATEGRKAYICFDHETKPKTLQNVNVAIARTGRLFNDARCKTFVVSLPGPEKGVDDFIAAQGEDAFHGLVESAMTLGRWQGKRYRELSYKPDVVVNQRYLSVELPKEGLACIKSAKGTGKTLSLIPIVRDANAEGRRVVVITHRIQLGRSICKRIGIEWIDENGLHSQEKQFCGLGLCFDSLWKLNPTDFEDGIVIIDECEQVIWHALNSATCLKKRVQLLEILEQILQNAGLIIAQDADLSDLSVHYLEALTGHKPWIALNEWKPEAGGEHLMFDGSDPSALWGKVEESIADGQKVFICVDSQKAKGGWSTVNLEARLKSLNPALQILRIDSESVAEPNHAAEGCIEKLNEVLKNYDVVIASPTLGTGVSIDLKGHFDAVVGIFHGAIPVDEARQFLARVRENCPRWVWARKLGLGRIGGGSIFAHAVVGSKTREVKINISRLRDVDFDIDAISEGESNSFSRHFKTWAEMAARVNCGAIEYFDALTQGLREEGQNVAVMSAEKDDIISDAMKATRNASYEAYTASVEQANEIDESRYEQLKEKRSLTKEERFELRKHELEKRYELPADVDLVERDDDGWYAKLRLHYYLTHDPEFVQSRDKRHLDGHLERGDGKLCLQDVRLLTAQIELMKAIGVLGLLDPNREIRATDPDVQRMVELLAHHSKDVKAVLGISVSPAVAKEKPMQIVQAVLKKMDIKLECIRREVLYQGDTNTSDVLYQTDTFTSNPGYISNKQQVGQPNQVGRDTKQKEERIRVYAFKPPTDKRDAVFAAWERRDLGEVEANVQPDEIAAASNVQPNESNVQPIELTAAVSVQPNSVQPNESSVQPVAVESDCHVQPNYVQPDASVQPISNHVQPRDIVSHVSEGWSGKLLQIFGCEAQVDGGMWVRWFPVEELTKAS